jgi:hypothetical protein
MTKHCVEAAQEVAHAGTKIEVGAGEDLLTTADGFAGGRRSITERITKPVESVTLEVPLARSLCERGRPLSWLGRRGTPA